MGLTPTLDPIRPSQNDPTTQTRRPSGSCDCRGVNCPFSLLQAPSSSEQTVLRPPFQDNLGKAVPERLNQSGFE